MKISANALADLAASRAFTSTIYGKVFLATGGDDAAALLASNAATHLSRRDYLELCGRIPPPQQRDPEPPPRLNEFAAFVGRTRLPLTAV